MKDVIERLQKAIEHTANSGSVIPPLFRLADLQALIDAYVETCPHCHKSVKKLTPGENLAMQRVVMLVLEGNKTIRVYGKPDVDLRLDHLAQSDIDTVLTRLRANYAAVIDAALQTPSTGT